LVVLVSQDFHFLKAHRLGMDTQAESMVFLRKDSLICRAEGLTSHNRILLDCGGHEVIATLYHVDTDFLAHDQVGLSDATWRLLQPTEGEPIRVSHAPLVASLSLLRRRIFGQKLGGSDFHSIIADIVAARYSALETTAFVTACAANPLGDDEIEALTRAMVDNGQRIGWNKPVVADKHSVGGLPGNRTTPIIVAICAALGVTIPKTSSRAITSPAGTADTMEVLAPVVLDEIALRTVVEQESGCIAWGGAVALSPADDILIRIERALDLDSEGQMIASILSKKIAAGITHLVVDMPVGPTAKVRTPEDARRLELGLLSVAKSFGIQVRIVRGDGRQPIGRGIGPALEARDVLAVLACKPGAPADLRARSLELAGALLELAGRAPGGGGEILAASVLDSGQAWTKFLRICDAQGGLRPIPAPGLGQIIPAIGMGVVAAIDNRRIARLAKLAGAPEDKAAGIDLHVRLGDEVRAGAPLCTVHAQAEGELAYAMSYAHANPDIFQIVA
jgi:thymidine phosphorylase